MINYGKATKEIVQKMKDGLEKNIEIEQFEFHSSACQCVLDVANRAPGEPPIYLFKFCSIPAEPIHFHYSSRKGLIRASDENKVREEDILAQLIDVNTSNPENLIKFFEKNGFLFPLETTSYKSFLYEELCETLERLKAVVLLMGTIAGTRNYKEMMKYASYLLFHKFIKKDNDQQHPFATLMDEALNYTEKDWSQEIFDKGTHTIVDKLYPRGFSMDNDTYQTIRQGNCLDNRKGSDSDLFRRLFFLFFNHEGCSPELRKIVVFFFHYQYEVGFFRCPNKLEVSYYAHPELDKFSDAMKAMLLEISKDLIATEINTNILGIHPQYNEGDLKPSWKIESLLQALYFSVFFMKPGVEMYKRCKNPKCKRDGYFLVSTTNDRREYCCEACRNADAQRRQRLRRKEEKG